MSTRSLITFEDEYDGKEIVVVYRQSDGYPSVRGRELAKFLDGMVVGNGIGSDAPAKYANGMSELAAKWVMHEKSKNPSGNVYLHAAGTRGMDEEWVYQVKTNKTKGFGGRGKVFVTVTDVNGNKVYNSIADAIDDE